MRSLPAGLTLAIFFAFPASAQFGVEPVTILVSPEYPRPYDTVYITPRSTQISLAASRVTITANGSVIEEGSGERSAAVVLGGPGSSTTIKVTAVTGGVTYAAETTIRPADVALVLEPLTTSHPLYEGSPLVAPEGLVRLVALADFRNASGARISPDSLSYAWRLGNKMLTEESGIGQSTLTATAPMLYRDADVSVTVTTPDGRMAGQAHVEVSPSSPALFAYRTDPLLGIDLAHAITRATSLFQQEESFVAVPFHFSFVPRIAWILDGEPAGTNPTLTIRSDKESSGRAQVEFSARNDAGQYAGGSFDVNFGQNASGIFKF